MKITATLLGEHGVFYAQFDHLEQTVPNAETLAQVHSQGALLGAALYSHAHLEGELLFNTLEPRLGPMGPLAVMRMEHDEIEGALAELPEIQDVAEARRRLLHIVRVARDHFAKEERVLYPMEPDTLTRLGRLWAQQRQVSIVG